MSERPLLETSRVRPEVLSEMASFHAGVVGEVKSAILAHDVVVVGMAQNPHVKRARKALDDAKIPFRYLEYGSYFSKWKERLAVKLWSGYPTFPQVYVKGTLIGGASRTEAAIADGSIKAIEG